MTTDKTAHDARHRLVTAVHREDGAALVRRYFGHDTDLHAGFTGAWFERIGGDGSAEEVADRFTAADIVAVSTLSVTVPPMASVDLLHLRADELNGLLTQIPRDIDPGTKAGREQLVATDSPSNRLWEALQETHGIGWVTANKLLARKRPELLPIYDTVVRDLLSAPDSFWTLLADSWTDLKEALAKLREDAGIERITLLRTLDVLLWRIGKEEGADALRQLDP